MGKLLVMLFVALVIGALAAVLAYVSIFLFGLFGVAVPFKVSFIIIFILLLLATITNAALDKN